MELKKLEEALQKCQYKGELEIFLKSLFAYEIKDFEEMSKMDLERYKAFASQLREKILSIVLEKGDVGESFYLASYLVFAPLEGLCQEGQTNHQKCDSLIQTAEMYFLQEGIGEIENLMLLELGVLCRILKNDCSGAIRRYIQGISHLDMHSPMMGKSAEFIRDVFPKMGITMEVFIASIEGILGLDHYTSLPLMRARSILNWQIHCFWNVPSFFNHRSWLMLYPLWRELFYHYLKSSNLGDLDHAMYMQFFIYHMCGNSYSSQEEWRGFCEEIDQIASQRYADFGRANALSWEDKSIENQAMGGKKIIGILRDRIVENSPFKVEYSFCKQVLSNEKFRSQYTIKIYLMSLLEKSENSPNAMQKYRELGIEIIDASQWNKDGFYNSHLQKALWLNEQIRKDGVEVLLSPNNGYGISDFLLSVRSAKRQIFWSHGNFVYDLPSLNGRMTHICGDASSIIHEGFEFAGIPVVMDNEFYNPPIPQEIIKAHRAKYPQDRLIIGTIGRLTKINSMPYLQMILSLMREFPNTIYLACGSGNLAEIQEKLRQILGEEYESFVKERFYFCGYVDSAIYGHIIDIWLDSFPMEQGESRIEYVAKGNLSLVLLKTPQESLKKRLTFALDEEDYKSKARYLLSLDSEQKQSLINESLEELRERNLQREKLGAENFLKILA